MVSLCADFRPSELRRLGRHLLELVAPEIAEAEEAKRLENEEQRAREKTSLRTRLIGDGLARTTIVHPVLDRDRLLTYLESYTSPRKHQRRDQRRGGPDPAPPAPRPSLRRLLRTPRPRRAPRPRRGRDHRDGHHLLGVTANATSAPAPSSAANPSPPPRSAGWPAPPQIIPVVLGGKGEILDLGRTRRLFSPAQRKALRLRDQRCRAEGCTIPAAWCEAHHLKPWVPSGKTNLDDGILACNWHHHRLHDPRYGHELLPNGDLRFHRRR